MFPRHAADGPFATYPCPAGEGVVVVPFYPYEGYMVFGRLHDAAGAQIGETPLEDYVSVSADTLDAPVKILLHAAGTAP